MGILPSLFLQRNLAGLLHNVTPSCCCGGSLLLCHLASQQQSNGNPIAIQSQGSKKGSTARAM